MKRVKRIRLEMIMGLEELEIEPGKVTILEGGNRVGKTSGLEGIRALVGGGYDATLVRAGAEEGRGVLVFEDEMELEKRIRATGGGDVSLRHPDLGKVSAPQSYLSGAIDGLGLNPVTFLTAKNRAELLLQALPMTVDHEQLLEAVDGDEELLRGIDASGHALEVIERVSKRVYDERTGVNRLQKDQQSTAEKLRASLAEAAPSEEDLAGLIKQARREKAELDSALSIQVNQIDRKAERDVQDTHEARDARVRELQEEIERVRQAAAEQVEEIRTKASRARQKAQAARQPQLAELDREISKLEERSKHADQVRRTREVLEQAQAQADEHLARSKALTATLARLGGLKLSLEQRLPIEGVSIRDGDVHVDNVPFHRVNLERQVRVSVDIAALRAKDIGLVCVDQLECLEKKYFDAFVAELQKREGLQAVLTRVTEGPLTVRTLEAEEVADGA